jgi:hypothetical protein
MRTYMLLLSNPPFGTQVSKSCPQRGCFNCPNYSNPGLNPYFKAKHQEAEHARASEFIENGMATPFRKTLDL